MEAKEIAILCAQSASDKKAHHIQILDLRGLSSVADFFVIGSADSIPQLKAIAREVERQLHEAHGLKPRHREGAPESLWMVLDYTDVLVHLFIQKQREYYTLEDLWSDAPILEWDKAIS